MLAKQLTIASRCPSTPMTVGHASTSAVSLQSVPSVTGVGHCRSNGCTRATSLTICRSIRGWTTADSCREDTVTVCLYIAIMQLHEIQHKTKGMLSSGEVERIGTAEFGEQVFSLGMPIQAGASTNCR